MQASSSVPKLIRQRCSSGFTKIELRANPPHAHGKQDRVAATSPPPAVNAHEKVPAMTTTVRTTSHSVTTLLEKLKHWCHLSSLSLSLSLSGWLTPSRMHSGATKEHRLNALRAIKRAAKVSALGE